MSQLLRLITSQNIGVWLLLAAWTNNINSYASPHTVFTATKQQQMSLSVAQAPTLWVLEPRCGGPTGFEPCTCIHNVTWRFKDAQWSYPAYLPKHFRSLQSHLLTPKMARMDPQRKSRKTGAKILDLVLPQIDTKWAPNWHIC